MSDYYYVILTVFIWSKHWPRVTRSPIDQVDSENEDSDIRALASARGSVPQMAQSQIRQPLEGPKGPRTSKAQSSFRRLPVLLYVFHDSAKNRYFHGTI